MRLKYITYIIETYVSGYEYLLEKARVERDGVCGACGRLPDSGSLSPCACFTASRGLGLATADAERRGERMEQIV